MSKRKRQTSPYQKHPHSIFLKRHKTTDQSDTESEYQSAVSDSSDIQSNLRKVLATMCSKQDLEEVVARMLEKLKVDLVHELKNELQTEFARIVEVKTKELSTEVSELRHEVMHLRNCVKTANTNNDDLEQYGRRMMLDISNIPGDTGDAQEDIQSKILNFANKKLNIELKVDDIDKEHRIGKFHEELSGNRRVIVKLTNSKARQRVYNARKSTADGIFIQESLTREREQLALYEARKLKRKNKREKTWIAGGNVYGLMSTDGIATKVIIKTMEAVQEIRDGIEPKYPQPAYP